MKQVTMRRYVLKITQLALELTHAGEAQVWVEFSGHVNSFDMSISETGEDQELAHFECYLNNEYLITRNDPETTLKTSLETLEKIRKEGIDFLVKAMQQA